MTGAEMTRPRSMLHARGDESGLPAALLPRHCRVRIQAYKGLPRRSYVGMMLWLTAAGLGGASAAALIAAICEKCFYAFFSDFSFSGCGTEGVGAALACRFAAATSVPDPPCRPIGLDPCSCFGRHMRTVHCYWVRTHRGSVLT